jgi:zinc finger HIT domain-containing protein 1
MPHIEVLQTAASAPAPGWAYVVDRAIDPSKTALNPSGTRKNKRAVRSTVASASAADGTELTRREQVAIQRRLAELDKDAPSGVIEVPAKWRGLNGGGGTYGVQKGSGNKKGGAGAGGASGGGKITTNVRRVLLSEKTFLHHLADEEALRALASQTPGVSARTVQAHAKKAEQQQQQQTGGSKRASIGGTMLPPPTPTSTTPGADISMPDAPPLQTTPSLSTKIPQIPQPSDTNNALLQTSVPTLPSQEELESLLSAPPLSYNAARAAPPLPSSKGGPPQRHFCEMCGYWGRVRCLKCGARVCGLECKEVHDVDCRKKFN